MSAEHLARLRAEGRIVVETQRYGNTYAIDRKAIEVRQAAGSTHALLSGCRTFESRPGHMFDQVFSV